MTPKIKVVCLECGKAFQTTKDIPECPRCGGVDIDVREPEPPEEPCLPDGTPVFRSRKPTRAERLHAAADAGYDTWDDYRRTR